MMVQRPTRRGLEIGFRARSGSCALVHVDVSGLPTATSTCDGPIVMVRMLPIVKGRFRPADTRGRLATHRRLPRTSRRADVPAPPCV